MPSLSSLLVKLRGEQSRFWVPETSFLVSRGQDLSVLRPRFRLLRPEPRTQEARIRVPVIKIWVF